MALLLILAVANLRISHKTGGTEQSVLTAYQMSTRFNCMHIAYFKYFRCPKSAYPRLGILYDRIVDGSFRFLYFSPEASLPEPDFTISVYGSSCSFLVLGLTLSLFFIFLFINYLPPIQPWPHQEVHTVV